MAGTEPIYFRGKQGLRDDIDEYAERFGYEDRSKAVRKLVQIGLRESSMPLTYRFKDFAIDASFILAVVAFSFAGLGYLTDIVELYDGIVAGGMFIVMAASLIATVELLRVVSGQSILGEFAKEAFR